MSEWLKEHAWKVCIGQKPIAGSNPARSAKPKSPQFGAFFISGSLSAAQANGYEKRSGRRRSRGFWVCSHPPPGSRVRLGSAETRRVIPAHQACLCERCGNKKHSRAQAAELLFGFEATPSGITSLSRLSRDEPLSMKTEIKPDATSSNQSSKPLLNSLDLLLMELR